MNQAEQNFNSAQASLGKRLWQLAATFLKLGAIAFGGPQAEIAVQHAEVVSQRQWLTQAQFTEGIAICELLPGPAATQVAIYIGYVRAKQLGALVAGIAFILPAFLLVLFLSWAYFRFQQLPQISALFLGVSPVVIALIVDFCWQLARTTLQTRLQQAIAIAVFVCSLLHVNPLTLLLLAGLVGSWQYGVDLPHRPNQLRSIGLPLAGLLASSSAIAQADVWGTERIRAIFWPLTLFFLKVGGLVYGGGLVIVPLMEAEVVRQQWLAPGEFLVAVAIGQLSPGPVTLTAAVIGYKVAGVLGAIVATVAIFLPSFAFIMLVAPWLLKLRETRWLQGFLQGITPAVLGAIAATTIPLARHALIQPTVSLSIASVGIGAIALVALLHYKTPPWLLVPGGALLGGCIVQLLS